MDFVEWLEYELVIQEGGDWLDKMEDFETGKSQMKECENDKRAARTIMTVYGAAHDTVPQVCPAEAAASQEAVEKPKTGCK